MRWNDWLLVSVTVSMVGHILLERVWLVRYFRKQLDGLDDDQVREKLNSLSTVKREVFRYACYNGKSKGVMRVVLPILAVAWVPLLAIFAVLAGLFYVLGMVWFEVSGWWMHYKRSRMTPEARAAELTRMEGEALRSIAELKDDPAFLTSQHPADRANREITLKIEEIIHRARQKKAEDATSA